MKKKEKFNWENLYTLGQIGTALFCAIMVGIPIILGFYYHALPPVGVILQAGGVIIITHIPLFISETIGFAQVFGPSTYIAVITGNATSIKLPVALNALSIAKKEQATDAGDAIVTFGVAISSIVSILIIALGIFLLNPLSRLEIFSNIETAGKYIIPALMGGLVIFVFNKKQGNKIVTNKALALVPCAIFVISLFFLGHWNISYTGILILVMIPVTIVTSIFLYKKKIIKIIFYPTSKKTED